MIPAVAGALIGGISGLVGAGAQLLGQKQASETARKNTDLQNKANRELAEYQYSKDLEMWNKGNAYNDPTSQMARLKKAGLNPNLVYGNGSATTQAVSLPKYQAPTMSYNYKPPVDPLAMLGAFQDFSIKNAQIDNLRAQNENIQADTALKVTNEFVNNWKYKGWAQGIGYENAIKRENMEKLRRENRVGQSIEPYQADMYRTTLNKAQAEAKLKSNEANFYDWGAWSRLLQGFGLRLPSFRK